MIMAVFQNAEGKKFTVPPDKVWVTEKSPYASGEPKKDTTYMFAINDPCQECWEINLPLTEVIDMLNKALSSCVSARGIIYTPNAIR